MFQKILIANRGEIACRVIATARRLGVATVAVYSEADAGARHVAMADQSIAIGAAAAAESYLNGERIIAAALNTGAEAIHPGYGFLSENPDFVEAVAAAGLVFIGPTADAIRAMGLKDAAKALMAETGVPIVPGYHGADQDPGRLAAAADEIGYPVLIKARAGGGGKGMRLVKDPSQFAAALEGAQREGQASFGDPHCLIEKYIQQPRHIEIQVFGDAHGNVVHLFERDCSLQRRHQKVIEEAPAPGMTAEMRAAMGQAAVAAARAIGYQGAGTVEFIVDGAGPLRPGGFWFMEMNTRLQVEHPVSEAITGLDFVELQLRIAAGEALPIAQDELTFDGWSFEARLYAEDAAKGFLPATGRLSHLGFPEAAAAFAAGSLRVDSGVRPGDEISPWYDPMVAKIIAHGPTRSAALNQLSHALAATEVDGCVTNRDFLLALTRHAGFRAGDVDTGLIARDYDALTAEASPPDLAVALAAIAGRGLLAAPASADPWDQLADWRHWGAATQPAELLYGDAPIAAVIETLGPGRYRAALAETDVELAVAALGGARYRVIHDGADQPATVLCAPGSVTLFMAGRRFAFQRVDPLRPAAEAAAGGDVVTAPMPGLVKAAPVRAGEAVAAGQALLVLEAMKMEHTLTAPRDGQVAEMLAAPGDQVAEGAVLVRLEPADD